MSGTELSTKNNEKFKPRKKSTDKSCEEETRQNLERFSNQMKL